MIWLTRHEAADRLRVTPRAIDHLVARGKLTRYRHGPRIVRFRADDVDALLTPEPTTRRTA